MRWEGFIDPDGIHKAIEVLQKPGSVFEVRVVGASAGRKDIFSGYFRDADTVLTELDKIDIRGKNIYITLGEVKEECFARSQSEHFERNPSTTADNEIESYRWLFVDLDPVRPTGISASDEEVQKAKLLSFEVLAYLQDLGFAEPVRGMSGNGYHLLYRIDIRNDPEGRRLIERCLKVLSSVFDTDAVKIDTTNSNPSRICKLYGTLAQKGTSTEKRPHRMSGFISIPEDIKVNGRAVLEQLAGELPEQAEPQQRRQGTGAAYKQQEFDLPDFLSRAGLTYTETASDRSKIFRLDHCPFDSSHTNGDAKIFWYPDGAIAFKCHHNSCRRYKWQDVRLKYEPDAYDQDPEDQRIDEGYQKHKKQKAEQPEPEEPVEKPKKKKPFRKLKTADGLLQKELPDLKVFVGVGEELPLLVEGTCILSAKPKLGKSWFALALCMAVAKGEDFLGYKTQQASTLYLDLETDEVLEQKRLRRFLKGDPAPDGFYIDNETVSLEGGFVEQIEHYLQEDPKIGIVVIDVFQIIRTASKSQKETEYEHAYRDITPLNELAQKYHISIILVCHDRKAVDPDDPFSNILGSTGLQGAATQMIVMFRKRPNDPIHISVKGKTIDGLPELNVKLEDARWTIVDGVNLADREKMELLQEYQESPIRTAVVEIAENYPAWRGRCSQIINDAIELGIPVTETPKVVGGFIHKHQGRFLELDSIKIAITSEGTASKTYRIQKSTIGTIGKNQDEPLVGFIDPSIYGDTEIPFL